MKALEITGEYLRFKGDFFDSRNRHVRQPASPANVQFWMTQGPNLAVKVVKYSGGWDIGWRWECGPLSISPGEPFNNTYDPVPGFAVDRGAAA